MVYIEGDSYLELLFHKVLCFEHDWKNFRESLPNNVVAFGFCFKKAPSILTGNEDFHTRSKQNQ